MFLDLLHKVQVLGVGRHIYIFMIINGVSGLLLIIMIWRYGDMGLGVGIFVMFSFV